MSLGAVLSTALSGLTVSQRSLTVTANNVANANTEGYSRKQANQMTRILDGWASGVTANDPTRVVDTFLNAELRRQESALGRSGKLADIYSRIELGVFGPPGESDRGLSAQLGRLIGSLEQLANDPESRPLRSELLGAIDDFLRQSGRDMQTVQQLRADADQEVGRVVAEINRDIQELHKLNLEFARTGGTADLADRRDQVLLQLAEKIDISIFRHDNGTIAVHTSGGHALLEYGPRILHYRPSATVGQGTVFNAIEIYDLSQIDKATGAPLTGAVGRVLVSGGVRAEATPELLAAAADAGVDVATMLVRSPLRGGELQGLIEARDRVLPNLADQLVELSEMVAYTMNRVHNAALPQPLPSELAGSRAGLDDYDTATRSGTATLVVFDSQGTVVADFTIDLAAAATPEALAAQINASLGAFGTAAVDPLVDRFSITLGLDGFGGSYRFAWDEGDSAITVTDSAGRSRDYGFAHFFGLNDLVVATGSGPLDRSVRADIVADSRRLSNAVLTREAGLPVVGGVGDNRGLQALAAAFDQPYTTIARGGLPAAATTIGRYLADIVSVTAADAARTGNEAAADRALVEDLQFRQGAISGVNLDEELAKLVLFQQAYNVSARLISITNELFAELLDMTR